MTPSELRALNRDVHRDVMRQRILTDEEMRANDRGHPALTVVDGIFFRVIPHPIVGGEPTFEQAIPNYAGSSEFVAKVEAEIARRGVQPEYLRALQLEVLADVGDCFDADRLYRLVTASAEWRCRAALTAVRSREGTLS